MSRRDNRMIDMQLGRLFEIDRNFNRTTAYSFDSTEGLSGPMAQGLARPPRGTAFLSNVLGQEESLPISAVRVFSLRYN
ncbi:hypothetical protein BT69DRAFT_788673 [Atractiella rhizophila]|nr:hypothetical protein BT69DRAFT_788673 [Atractiella rhizophila]